MGIDTDAMDSRARNVGKEFTEELHKRTMVDEIIFDPRLTGVPNIAVFVRWCRFSGQGVKLLPT